MNTALFLALLMTPPWDDPSGQTIPETPHTWALLKTFAKAHELVGPHETWYRWEAEVTYVRTHYHSLRDAPPLGDVSRLPPREVVRQALAFARSYQRGIKARERGAFPWEKFWYEETLSETSRIIQVYELMMQVHGSSAWAAQRHGLHQLRSLLGEELYSAGMWPDPAPVYRMSRID